MIEKNAVAPEKDDHKRAIRLWMQGVLEKKEWSIREWTSRTGIASSTVSRFLNSGVEYQFTPSVETLRKLSQTAGVDMPVFSSTSRTVNLYVKTGATMLTNTFTDQVVSVLRSEENLEAILVETGTMEDTLMVDDIVLVEPCGFEDISEGQIVMCVTQENLAAPYRKISGKLVPSAPLYATMDPADVVVYGRVHSLNRSLL